MGGLVLTIAYTLIVITISLVMGVPVAWGRLSRNRAVRVSTAAYVNLFRSTPLLIQLVYIYYALPVIGISLSAPVAGVVGLTLHYTAYIAEVYRGAIEAVPQGQRDAASALGMSSRDIELRVILPQAVRSVIPALGNYFVGLFKDTSLLSVLTVQELLFTGQLIAAKSYDYFTIYTMIFLIYLIVGSVAIWLVRRIERRVASRSRIRRRPRLVLKTDVSAS
jgi:His/Glu/Gln/Arg/opine family amino acid ABC transporter permease subunit